jgi:hypothetical protein
MVKIRLVTFYEVPNCWNITNDEDDRDLDVQLGEYVFDNIDNITAPGFEIEDFEIPDNLTMDSNKEFVVDICQGRSFNAWNEAGVDFGSEYYQNWIFFKNKENSWEEF